VYGDVGGDGNRRGNGYSPFSCQKILMEHPPGPGEAHGCPYRHFSMENLTGLLQQVGIKDTEVLRGVKEDKEKQKFHLACNRYVLFLFWLSPLGKTGILLTAVVFLTTYTSRRSKRLRTTGRGRRISSRRWFIQMSISSAVIC